MRLHRKVLARPEGAADSGHRQAHLLRRETQDAGQLILVDVQPLRSDVEVDAARTVGDGKARLGSQRRLVLHADHVLALHDHVRASVLVAVTDLDVAKQVAGWMEARRAVGERLLGGRHGLQHLVVDAHLLSGTSSLLWMIGGDQRHGLAPVAHEVEREHRLVLEFQAVELLAGDVLVREDRAYARHR